jgi:hypothetical protein
MDTQLQPSNHELFFRAPIPTAARQRFSISMRPVSKDGVGFMNCSCQEFRNPVWLVQVESLSRSSTSSDFL